MSLGYWFSKEKFDEDDICFNCKTGWTTTNRRHHCRYCKRSFCGTCCFDKMPIPDHGVAEAVRVCVSCRDVIRGKRTEALPDTAPEDHTYNFDLIVIGGGSGGLACAKEAAKLKKDVLVLDYVHPSPQGTTWGLGGTCVNVGCIPKKLMHQASLLREAARDAKHYGWGGIGDMTHSWETLVGAVQAHIVSLNAGYEKQMKSIDGLVYKNAYATFKDRNTIIATATDGTQKTHSARRIVVAVGGRPNFPEVPGAKECCITSDDIFSLKAHPGKKVLVVGASYVALECAGFLHGVGCEVTVMVRSILLRGFDQECANKIGDYMEEIGIKFIRGSVPSSLNKTKDGKAVVCHWKLADAAGPASSEQFDTVLLAIGRTPVTKDLKLCCAGVMRLTNHKIPVFQEQSNVPHIYAIGDVSQVEGSAALELTPVAIQAGKLLARRLFNKEQKQMNYKLVPTTIFTPIEYGCVGLTEDDAKEAFGQENIETFLSVFQPLEMTLPNRMNTLKTSCFCKVVLNYADSARLVGFHYMGPNAGEVTQGFALAMIMGATKDNLDACVGIHPTCAETLTTLDITKGSGKSAVKEDC